VALADGPELRAGSVERFPNREFDSLGTVLRTYLGRHGTPNCDAACAAIAGPVDAGTGRLTNLDWSIDLDGLAEAAQAETVDVLNDLQAQGHGVIHVPGERLRQVLPGAPETERWQAPAQAPKIVIGVGTGFNIAPIYPQGDRTLVTASEAGHSSLPVSDADGLSLSRYVAHTHGFADIEEVLSGRGVENIYAWVTGTPPGAPAPLSAAEILQGFEQHRTPETLKAAQVFAAMLGAVAGDLALTHLPYGGIYFSGGVARAFAPYLHELGFQDSFAAKGRFSDLMRRFPVHVIEDDFAALLGCAGHLCERLGAQKASRLQ
jgi:glucokinase